MGVDCPVTIESATLVVFAVDKLKDEVLLSRLLMRTSVDPALWNGAAFTAIAPTPMAERTITDFLKKV